MPHFDSLALVKQSYSFTINNLKSAFNLLVFWGVIFLAFNSMMIYFAPAEGTYALKSVIDPMTEEFPKFDEEVRDINEISVSYYIAFILYIFVYAFATCQISIAWHRKVILGEVPKLTASSKKIFQYMWKVFLYGLILGLILLVLILPMGFLSSISGISYDFLNGLFVVILGLMLVARISLSFVAIALGGKKISFYQSSKMTSGYSFKLLIGLLLCFLPFVILDFIKFDFLQEAVPIAVFSTIIMLLEIITQMIVVAYMSYVYLFFKGRDIN